MSRRWIFVLQRAEDHGLERDVVLPRNLEHPIDGLFIFANRAFARLAP